MKKTKFVVGILVLSLMLMGAGFAAWSQQFTVTNTVDTGEWDIKVDAVIKEGANLDYMTAVLSDETTNPTMTINEMYPGTKVVYEVTYTNDSTLAVKVDPSVIQQGFDVSSELTFNAQLIDTEGDGGRIEPGKTDTYLYTIEFPIGATASENLALTTTHDYSFTQFNQ